MPLDKSISNDRRKRKLAARIKQGVAQERAWYRAQREAAKNEAAKNQAFLLALPRAVPQAVPQAAPVLTVLNLTPEDTAALREFAEQYREQQREVAR